MRAQAGRPSLTAPFNTFIKTHMPAARQVKYGERNASYSLGISRAPVSQAGPGLRGGSPTRDSAMLKYSDNCNEKDHKQGLSQRRTQTVHL
jgi:hypothetical protein